MRKVFDYLHHLFVPKEKNNFRAKALHTDFLTYYLIFALFLTFAFKKISVNNVLGFATDITVEKLLELTNRQREQNNLPPLSYNEKLAKAAQEKAQNMFQNNYWSHYAPDGTTPWDFVLHAGYEYEYAGENLAKNFLFSQGVVDAWMNSKTHADNIMRREYSEIGFAIVDGVLNGEETTLVVQMFGKPLFSQTQPVSKIENPPREKPVEENRPIVLAKKTSPSGISIANISLGTNFVFIIFLAIALILDLYLAAHFKILRVSGKNLAHLIFIGFITLGLLLFTKGAIL
jgi:uncharacterized protein YkwD